MRQSMGKRNEVCWHKGGYTPFCADITEAVRGDGLQEIIVRAEDDPADLAKPRGKQDWKLEPHSIWYPRTTGIWQTVWLEVVPQLVHRVVRWTSNLERWEIGIEATSAASAARWLMLAVRLSWAIRLLADDTYAVVSGEVHRRIALSDPGIDDYRNDLLWSPSSPPLIDAELELRDARTEQCSTALKSYTALRGISDSGRSVHPEWPAAVSSTGARPRLLAGERH